jgi:hypothetical protein
MEGFNLLKRTGRIYAGAEKKKAEDCAFKKATLSFR